MKIIEYDDRIETLNDKGELHSFNDNPAVKCHFGGYKKWYKDGELHRDNDKPACIYYNGSMKWYKEGRLYKEDYPTIF